MKTVKAEFNENNYPELCKIDRVRGDSKIIGDFLEWLSSQDFEICIRETNGYEEYRPSRKSINSFLYSYFEIDEKAAEKERAKLLESLRVE